MYQCVNSFKSLTHAERARRILKSEGIHVDIVNLDRNVTKHGCAFGISFDCRFSGRLRKILKDNDLAYGEIIGRNN